MTYPNERKFRVGQRVRLSESGVKMLTPWSKKLKPNSRGTVKAYFSTLGLLVHVDGYKRPISYHMDFWQPLRASPSTTVKK